LVLTASVKIYPNAEVSDLLQSINEDLKQLLIVSQVEVADRDTQVPQTAQKFETLSIEVSPATGETCERCWIVTEEVGKDEEHSTLCLRCASVVKEM